MSDHESGVFGPQTVRRMAKAYRYAHDIAVERSEAHLAPEAEQELARAIVESAKIDKTLPRQLVRSVVDRVLLRKRIGRPPSHGPASFGDRADARPPDEDLTSNLAAGRETD